MTPVCNTCWKMIFGLVCKKAPKAGKSIAYAEMRRLCCGRREEHRQSPEPSSRIRPCAAVRGARMLFAGLQQQQQHQKSLAWQQHGQTSPAEPGIPRRTACRTGQPSPTQGCPQTRAAPKKAPSQFGAEVPVPTVPNAGSARAGDRTLARCFSLMEPELSSSEVGRGGRIP